MRVLNVNMLLGIAWKNRERGIEPLQSSGMFVPNTVQF